MKPELINLLHRLASQGQSGNPSTEAFQSLILFPNGRAIAIFRQGSIPFPGLDDLEHFAYTGAYPASEPPREAGSGSVHSTAPVTPSPVTSHSSLPQ